MKAVQTVKKMVALGMGLTMVGATVFGASALKLSDWPAPFVVDGTPASNLAVVVGDAAAGGDVVGATDIIQGLQNKAVKKMAGVGGGTQKVVSGDAVEIGSTSDLLEINEAMGNVRETLTEVDLDMLKGGQIVTDKGATEYNQYLRFISAQTGAGRVRFDQDERDRVGHFLYWQSNQANNTGALLFQWELEFEEGLESDYVLPAGATIGQLPDLEDEDVTILGQPFVIVDAQVFNTSVVAAGLCGSPDLTIDFIGGAISAVLGENDKETYVVDGKEYEVEVLVISETANGGEGSVKFRINGEITDELTDGGTDVLADGTQIGIRDILATGKDIQKSIVQFYIGAYKVEFKDLNATGGTFTQAQVEVNEETIEDSWTDLDGCFSANLRTFTLNYIQYNLTADAVLGDMFVVPGSGVRENLDEPEGMLTPSWDIRYEGLMDTGVTLVRIDSAGNDEYDLEFTNQEGIFFDVPLASNEAATYKYGDDDDDLWFWEGNATQFIVSRQDFFVVSDCRAAPYNDIAGLTDDTCFTHVLRYDNIDPTNNRLTFTDLGTGTREISYSAATGIGRLVIGGVTYQVRVNAANNLAIDMNGDGRYSGYFNSTARNITGKALIGIQGEGLIDLGWQNHSAAGLAVPINVSGVAAFDQNTGVINWTAQTGALITTYLITLQKEFDESAGDEVLGINISGAIANRIHILQQSPYLDGFFAATTSYWSTMLDLEENEDLQQGLSGYGVFAELYDPASNDQAEDLTIEYPLTERGARVFVTGGVVQVSEVGTGIGEVLQPIQIGAAKLASEIADITQWNAVVVGGPCANPIAAELLGNPEPCWESVPENKAIVKLFEHANGNVAVLVNGRTALNTRMASRALATGEVAKVDGMEAQVTGTSLNDITVAAV
ncbi:hypothetical protein KY329_02610 [Candidatus Woesearchaeota archaeon]|nr:hypothetical protein [Candidatus Woesearchaeota archaeon]